MLLLRGVRRLKTYEKALLAAEKQSNHLKISLLMFLF